MNPVFTIRMENNPFEGEEVAEDILVRCLHFMKEDTQMGNDNFFVLEKEGEEALQVLPEGDQYRVEYLPPDKGTGSIIVFVKEMIDDRELIDTFWDFFEGRELDLSGYRLEEL